MSDLLIEPKDGFEKLPAKGRSTCTLPHEHTNTVYMGLGYIERPRSSFQAFYKFAYSLLIEHFKHTKKCSPVISMSHTANMQKEI